MSRIFRTNLVTSGECHSVIIPDDVVRELKLGDDGELEVQIISTTRGTRKVRANWAAAFQSMANNGDDLLLDQDFIMTYWQKHEW